MLSNWWSILRVILDLSSLTLNLMKTFLVGINIEEQRLKVLVGGLGCKNEKLPFSYLGSPLSFPLGVAHRKSAF